MIVFLVLISDIREAKDQTSLRISASLSELALSYNIYLLDSFDSFDYSAYLI